jgi:CheY-like chemotaxis protein
MLLKLYALVFQRGKFRVYTATSGQEAVAIYRAHARHIDMVLLDVCMPGLDGPATLRQLQQINPDLLVCFISGNTEDHAPDDLLRQGGLRLFPKPYPIDDLTREITSLLPSRLVHPV